MIRFTPSVAALFAAWGVHASAETRRLAIESPVDRFELVIENGRGSVNGKPADLSHVNEVVRALTEEVTGQCPEGDLGRPDLTVREGKQQRRVYIAKHLVAIDDLCLNVAGDGLLYAPIHRDFLIGSQQEGLPLKPELEISRDGQKILTLTERGDGWVASDPQRLVNRDFFDRFANSLKSYRVRTRVGLGAGAGKRRVQVKTGGRTYVFSKIDDVAWALEKPGAKWLETSDDWSFWYGFDDATFEDPNAERIRKVADPSRQLAERLAIAQRLEGAWSPNLRALYHRLVLEPNGDEKLKVLALKRLKQKPSRETAGVMIELLSTDQSNDLKREAVQILRLQNPKGPKFEPATADKTLAYWRKWWSAGAH